MAPIRCRHAYLRGSVQAAIFGPILMMVSQDCANKAPISGLTVARMERCLPGATSTAARKTERLFPRRSKRESSTRQRSLPTMQARPIVQRSPQTRPLKAKPMLDGVSLDQLRTFIAAVDEGSFSGASRKLLRSQSVVSDTIKTLEEQIGVALFDRSGRYPKLTAEGVVLLADARNIINGVDLLKARAKGMVAGLEPELSVVVDVFYPSTPSRRSRRSFASITLQSLSASMLKLWGRPSSRCSTGAAASASSARFRSSPKRSPTKAFPASTSSWSPPAIIRWRLRFLEGADHHLQGQIATAGMAFTGPHD
jgi:Bacterial regulatory helix-turn-helix protein, lysR family